MNRLPQIEEHVACDVCHRTMLRGEHAEPYLTPSRERRRVCELCAARAQQEGWIRESAAPHAPAQPQRPPERRGLRRWARRRESAAAALAEPPRQPREPEQHANGAESADREGADEGAMLTRLRKRAGPRSPRQVRAVPTNAQLKIDRALDLFNASEHPRTVAGIARALGAPTASALTSRASAAEVTLTVAWELSWYQFVVDLSDPREPVQLRAQGQELDELDEQARQWNLETDEEGRLAPLSGSAEEGEPVPVGAGEPALEPGGEEPA